MNAICVSGNFFITIQPSFNIQLNSSFKEEIFKGRTLPTGKKFGPVGGGAFKKRLNQSVGGRLAGNQHRLI